MRSMMFIPLILGTPALGQTTPDCAEQLRLYQSGSDIEYATLDSTGDGFCEATDLRAASFLGTETIESVRWRISDGILYGTDAVGEIRKEWIDLRVVGLEGGLFAQNARIDLDFSFNWDAETGTATFVLRQFVLAEAELTFDVTVFLATEFPAGLGPQSPEIFGAFSLTGADMTVEISGDCSDWNVDQADILAAFAAEVGDPTDVIAALPGDSFDPETKAILLAMMTPADPVDSPDCPAPFTVAISGNPIPLYGDWLEGPGLDMDAIAAALEGAQVAFREVTP